MADSRIFGTLTKKEAEVLREFLQRFITICPDDDGKIDPADRKRIAKVSGLIYQLIAGLKEVRKEAKAKYSRANARSSR